MCSNIRRKNDNQNDNVIRSYSVQETWLDCSCPLLDLIVDEHFETIFSVDNTMMINNMADIRIV